MRNPRYRERVFRVLFFWSVRLSVGGNFFFITENPIRILNFKILVKLVAMVCFEGEFFLNFW
jgi:hypothetical protein